MTSPRARGRRCPVRPRKRSHKQNTYQIWHVCHEGVLQQLHLALCVASESWKPRRCSDIFNGIVPAVVSVSGPGQLTRGLGPAVPQITTHVDHDPPAASTRELGASGQRAGTPRHLQAACQVPPLPIRGFAHRVRSATCAQMLLSLMPGVRGSAVIL